MTRARAAESFMNGAGRAALNSAQVTCGSQPARWLKARSDKHCGALALERRCSKEIRKPAQARARQRARVKPKLFVTDQSAPAASRLKHPSFLTSRRPRNRPLGTKQTKRKEKERKERKKERKIARKRAGESRLGQSVKRRRRSA